MPKNLNPRFFMSLLMASDNGDDAGTSLNELNVLIIGLPPGRNDKM